MNTLDSRQSGFKVLLSAVVLLSLYPNSSQALPPSQKNREWVPNARIAVRIAEAVLEPLLGADAKRAKLSAIRQKGSWVVVDVRKRDPGTKGGDMKVILSAKDARIESVTLGE